MSYHVCQHILLIMHVHMDYLMTVLPIHDTEIHAVPVRGKTLKGLYRTIVRKKI